MVRGSGDGPESRCTGRDGSPGSAGRDRHPGNADLQLPLIRNRTSQALISGPVVWITIHRDRYQTSPPHPGKRKLEANSLLKLTASLPVGERWPKATGRAKWGGGS